MPGDLADVLGAALELRDDLHRGALALGVALDGAHRAPICAAVSRQQQLRPPRCGGAKRRPRRAPSQVVDNLLDRRELLLRSAGGLLGARWRSAPWSGDSSLAAAADSVIPLASCSVAAAIRCDTVSCRDEGVATRAAVFLAAAGPESRRPWGPVCDGWRSGVTSRRRG